jgi:hypothetical protein
MKTGSTSGVISISGGTQLGGVIAAMYLNASSSHAGLSIVCQGTGTGIVAVGVSTMGATCVKCGDLDGGTREASRMPNCTGMAEPTRIVEDRAEMVESSWMLSEMVVTIGIPEGVEMNEAIVMAGACWVVGAIGLVETSGMLVGMYIPSKK